MPVDFSWGNVKGINYLCTTKNQHIPQYCGSCWAQAVTASISDRIAIMRGGRFPEIDLAPKVLLTCDLEDNGCNGGEPLNALKWIHDNNITDSSCAPYQAKSHQEGLKCDSMAICKDCDPDAGCSTPKTFNIYTIKEYAKIPFNVEAIQNEIYARGPVVCSVNAGPIVGYTGGYVFGSDDPGETDHDISVVRWGVANDSAKSPYWIVRNSWGEYWGELGYIRIFRGNNTVRVEEFCVYGVPLNTWQNQHYPNKPAPVTTKKQFGLIETAKEIFSKIFAKRRPQKHRSCLKDSLNSEYITGPQPKDMPTALPENHWWGDIDGINYLSWIVN